MHDVWQAGRVCKTEIWLILTTDLYSSGELQMCFARLVTTSVQLLPVNRPIVVHRHAVILLLSRNKPCRGPVTAADILLNIITKYRSYPEHKRQEIEENEGLLNVPANAIIRSRSARFYLLHSWNHLSLLPHRWSNIRVFSCWITYTVVIAGIL